MLFNRRSWDLSGHNFCARRMAKERMEKFYRPDLDPTIGPKNLVLERERT